MSVRKKCQIRQGTVALSVFETENDGKILLSLDKDFVSRRVKGPLFTESELHDVPAPIIATLTAKLLITPFQACLLTVSL